MRNRLRCQDGVHDAKQPKAKDFGPEMDCPMDLGPDADMQYKKLTVEQKQIRRWRLKRNALVGKLLAENRLLTRQQALETAYRIMRHK